MKGRLQQSVFSGPEVAITEKPATASDSAHERAVNKIRFWEICPIAENARPFPENHWRLGPFGTEAFTRRIMMASTLAQSAS